MICMQFAWDPAKERDNIEKHHVSFTQAMKAFEDPLRLTVKDTKHSRRRNRYHEDRYYCIGYDGDGILTVRYTRRNQVTIVFGAGYWERGVILYEQRNG
jgi:uncharacterized DUF497 family protein